MLELLFNLTLGIFLQGFTDGGMGSQAAVAPLPQGQFEMREIGADNTESMENPWRPTGINGDLVQRADVEFSSDYRPYVMVEFTDAGAELLEQVTERNIGKPLGIFVGEQLISAPNVQEKIAGGRVQLTGTFTVQEATEIANTINQAADWDSKE